MYADLTVSDKFYLIIIYWLMVNHSSLVDIESWKNIAKLKIQRELQKAADRILGHYLRGADTIYQYREKQKKIERLFVCTLIRLWNLIGCWKNILHKKTNEAYW